MITTSGLQSNDHLTLYHISMTFKKKKAFENIVDKGENAGNKHFSFFPKGSLTFQMGI